MSPGLIANGGNGEVAAPLSVRAAENSVGSFEVCSKALPAQHAPLTYAPVLIWYWGRRGGGANFTLRLAKLLADAIGADRVSVAIARENEYFASFEQLGVNLMVTHAAWARGLGWRQRLRSLRSNLAFARKLKHGAFGTVLITMNFPLAWPLVRAIRRSSTRLIYVAHDAVPHPGDYMRMWQTWSQSRLIRRADTVVTLSSAVADRLLAIFARALPDLRARLRVIPIETVFSSARGLDMKPRSREVRFLFLGRLLEYKGLGLLHEALGRLDNRPDWSLTVAGSGPLEGFCAETFGRHPRCRVDLGWIDNERFIALLDEHDVLLCPYTEASQSGVIPEAIERGLAVVVTPVEGLPEQVGFGRFGLVADRTDVAAFASAMARILNQPVLLNGHAAGPSSDDDLRIKRQNWLSLLAQEPHSGAKPGANGEPAV
jgi:glycosyltransferase involved in cell wall biosynthesis